MSISNQPERTPIRRRAARAFILTPDRHVLLIQIRTPDGALVWITPGGGVERGEEVEAALLREVEEEVGLRDAPLGPLVHRLLSTFNWGQWRVSQRETFHAIHVDRFEPLMTDEEEAAMVESFRWWPVEELAGADDAFMPRHIAEILGRYLADGAADNPEEELVELD
jgi:8-oxo-dGTP pyrophosphatase MutT (NUDIX family)